MGKKENKYLENFFKAVLSLKTEEECEAFFEDVCTIKELQDMTYRLEVARRLSNGEVFNFESHLIPFVQISLKIQSV